MLRHACGLRPRQQGTRYRGGLAIYRSITSTAIYREYQDEPRRRHVSRAERWVATETADGRTGGQITFSTVGPARLRRDLNRLGQPEQAHNYNKVNADTEAGGQQDAHEARTIGESGRLQPLAAVLIAPISCGPMTRITGAAPTPIGRPA